MIIADKSLRVNLLSDFVNALSDNYFNEDFINFLAENYPLMLRILSEHLNIDVRKLGEIVTTCKTKKDDILKIIQSEFSRDWIIIRYKWISNQ